jgi:methionyl-tRNA formyltransferase
MRIAVAGTGLLGRTLMEPLLDSTHDVVAIVQNGRRYKGLNRWLFTATQTYENPQSPLGLARRNRIPIVWINTMTEAELAPLAELKPDLILVGSFSVIFKEPLLVLPDIGCVNCHSALLPRHRGPNPFSAAVASNDTETGITFHAMDPGIDTGDILLQAAIPIEPRDTARSLYFRTAELAGEHVMNLVKHVEDKGLVGTPQENERATYDARPDPSVARIDWTLTAEAIDRSIRAYYPDPLAHFFHGKRPVRVISAEWSANPVDAAPGTVLAIEPRIHIATGSGSITINQAVTGWRVESRWPTWPVVPHVGDVME